MNTLSRTITGLVAMAFGIWLLFFVGFVDGPKIDAWVIIIGSLIVAFGLYIFFNKKEDEIEKIKSLGGKNE